MRSAGSEENGLSTGKWEKVKEKQQSEVRVESWENGGSKGSDYPVYLDLGGPSSQEQ